MYCNVNNIFLYNTTLYIVVITLLIVTLLIVHYRVQNLSNIVLFKFPQISINDGLFPIYRNLEKQMNLICKWFENPPIVVKSKELFEVWKIVFETEFGKIMQLTNTMTFIIERETDQRGRITVIVINTAISRDREFEDFIPAIIVLDWNSHRAGIIGTGQFTVSRQRKRPPFAVSVSTCRFSPRVRGIMNFQDSSGRCRDIFPFSAGGTRSTDRLNYIFDVARFPAGMTISRGF